MAHPDERVVRGMYAAINQRDMDGLIAAFAPDAVWHGAGASIDGAESIAAMVGQLIEASEGTMQIELHDVLANDEHTVALQVTTAQRGDRGLSDNVVYVYHLRDGKIVEAWFTGDPRVQDEFWP
jgi:ketosteroid isomerase-like protein